MMTALHSFQNPIKMQNKENYKLITLMNIDTKFLNKILTNGVQQHFKKIYIMTNMVSFLGCKDGSTYINL
jgi:hypothetical protein